MLYQRILREGLSVRKVEALAQEDKGSVKKAKTADKETNPYEALQKELSGKTGLKVKIQEGKVTIVFANEEELQQIINRLS